MELLNTKTFNAMESGLSALWLQMQVSAQNIANYETPGYKAKSVLFEQVLADAQNKQANQGNAYRARIVEEDSTVVRPDGNNVDMTAENIKASDAAIQYQYLMQKVSGKFTNMRYVLENAPR